MNLWYNKYIQKREVKGDFKVNTTEKLLLEIQALKSQLELKNKEIEEQQAKITELEHKNKWFFDQWKSSQKKRFGKSSEKLDANQLTLDGFFTSLFNEPETIKEPIAIEPSAEVVIKEHTRKKNKRGTKLDNLPVEVIEYKLEDDNQTCNKCGSALTVMKKEIRKELVMIPPQVKVIEHVTYSYYCKNCNSTGIESTIVKADSPKALISKSLVSPSLMAYIICNKYVNSLPLYRQEQEFNRYGVALKRQDLSNWMIKAGKILTPLFNQIRAQLLTQEILHADETEVEVINEPGRKATDKSYMWVYLTGGETDTQIVMYDYSPGRSGDYAKEFLKGWNGKYLQTDGFPGYKKLPDITLCGCWVHARRKFHDAIDSDKRALEGIYYINRLLEMERVMDNANMTLRQRHLLRNTVSKMVLKGFYSWIEKISLDVLPKSMLGTAITYAVNQKEYLMSFLKDARINLSNNPAERAIKPFIIGRKNWLFTNTPNGARTSAILYTITQTALKNNLKPYNYLNYIFTAIQLNPNINAEDLLPWSMKIPNSCKISNNGKI